MQNLFYERKLSQVFDLKGSTRNRKVTVSGDRPGEVLMDENLIESELDPFSSAYDCLSSPGSLFSVSFKNALYVREASKKILREAIHNDTLFLSNLSESFRSRSLAPAHRMTFELNMLPVFRCHGLLTRRRGGF